MIHLDGDLSLTNMLDGDMQISEGFDGIAGVFQKVIETDVYDGPTEITPSEEDQVLRTSMKTVTQNIVVGKIPENYGRLIWNGNKLTVY